MHTLSLVGRPAFVRLALLSAAFGVAGPVQALSFNKLELSASGQIQHTLTVDLDGDGLNDLLATAREGKSARPQRTLYVWKGKTTGFSKNPDITLDLPWTVVGIDACDVDPAPGREIVALTAKGLEAFKAQGNGYAKKPINVMSLRPAVPYPDPADAPFLELCMEPKGAKTKELWVPVVRGVQIVINRGDVLEKGPLLPIWPVAENLVPDEFRGPRKRRDYSLLTQLAVPQLYSIDVDKDGDDDLLGTIEDRVWLFLRDGGTLASRPASQLNFLLRTEEEWRENKNRLQVFFGDVTGNGHPDAVTVKSTGSIQNLKTDLRVYQGKGAKGFEKRPVVTRQADGYAIPEGVVDLDGDGVFEILEPTLDTSPMVIARLVVTGKIAMSFVALKVKNGKFVEGDAMDLDFLFDPGGSGVKGTLPLFGYDVDGDKVSDRVDLGLGDQVSVVRGQKGNPVFQEDPAFTGSVPSSRKASWYWLREGSPASFVVFSPKDKEVGNRLYVFWNQAAR